MKATAPSVAAQKLHHHCSTPRSLMNPVRYLSLLAAILILVGCTGLRETSVEPVPKPEEPAAMPHPLAGSWSYLLETPQGVFSGMLEFSEADDGMLSGVIVGDDAPDEPANLQEITFEAEASKLAFTFDTQEFGPMSVDLTLDGDSLSGILKVVDYGFDVPMTGDRVTDDGE